MQHLAQLNIGRLAGPTDDPRVADFMANLDRINGIGKRMPGFVWMMEGSGEPGRGNTEVKVGGDPQFVSNLTVWESPEALARFVWHTAHRRFHERRHAWFQVLKRPHFVMWWIEAGHQPALDEGLARLDYMTLHGESDHAFGWSYLEKAQHRAGAGCNPMAAE